MFEPKDFDKMDDADVVAKKNVAIQWCANASAHARSYGGKPWKYVLVPHNAITENMTIEALVQQYGVE